MGNHEIERILQKDSTSYNIFLNLSKKNNK